MSGGRDHSGTQLKPDQSQAIFFLHNHVQVTTAQREMETIQRREHISKHFIVIGAPSGTSKFDQDRLLNSPSSSKHSPPSKFVLPSDMEALQLPLPFQTIALFHTNHPVKKLIDEVCDQPLNNAMFNKHIPLCSLKVGTSLPTCTLPTIPEHLPVTFHDEHQTTRKLLITFEDLKNDLKQNEHENDKKDDYDQDESIPSTPIQQPMEMPLIRNWRTTQKFSVVPKCGGTSHVFTCYLFCSPFF